jgi:cysteine desulfurase / selenocysteine lyase
MTTHDEFRRGLPATERYTYLNTAATSPTHEKVRAAMMAFEEDRARQAERGWDGWMDDINGVRKATAWFFECQPEEVALLKNTSDAINQVAGSIPWRQGDEVVTTDLEFPSNVLVWQQLARRGVTTKIVKSRQGRLHEEDVVKAISKKTRLVTFSSVAFSTGQRLDIQRIVEAAKERGAETLVDVIQGAGAVDTSFSKWGVDYLACGGHKWLMAPFGVGVLIMRKDLIPERTPDAVGWYGLEDAETYTPENTKLSDTARRFEIGNLNYGGFAGWRAALGILTTVPNREERVLKLSGLLIDRLAKSGIKAVTATSPKYRAGIVSVPSKDVEGAVLHLRKQNVLVAARGPYVRLSTHFWNTEEEVETAARLLIEHARTGGTGRRQGPPPQQKGRGRPKRGPKT